MKLLIPIENLSKFRSRDLIPLECEICNSLFYQPKNLVQRGLAGKRAVATCGNSCRKKFISKQIKNHFLVPEEKSSNHSEIKRTLVNYSGGKCSVCGYSKSLSSLVFHHKNPMDKSFSICRGITKKFSIKKLLSEVDKCILLCSNCHGEYHDGLISF